MHAAAEINNDDFYGRLIYGITALALMLMAFSLSTPDALDGELKFLLSISSLSFELWI